MNFDRLGGISAFVESVEAGNFAIAAEKLGVTRSAVGKSIARLEQRLGVRLLHRTTRSLSLTDDGQAYYERCIRALAELGAAHAAFDSGRREPVGRLRVSAPTLFGRLCVAPVLYELSNQHPRLEVELSLTDRVADLMNEGIDIAVRVGKLPDSSSLVARRVWTQRMGIFGSSSYLAAHGQPTDAASLDGHSAVVYCRGGVDIPWQLVAEDGNVSVPRVVPKLRLDDLQAIADAAVAGAGLAWLPCWLGSRYMQTEELVMVMSGDRVASTDIHVVWPQAKHLPSKTRVTIDALIDRIPKLIAFSAQKNPTSPKRSL